MTAALVVGLTLAAVAGQILVLGRLARMTYKPQDTPERDAYHSLRDQLARAVRERDEALARLEVEPRFHCETHMCGSCAGCKAAGIRDDNTRLRNEMEAMMPGIVWARTVRAGLERLIDKVGYQWIRDRLSRPCSLMRPPRPTTTANASHKPSRPRGRRGHAHEMGRRTGSTRQLDQRNP